MEDNTWKEKTCANCLFFERFTDNDKQGKCKLLSGDIDINKHKIKPTKKVGVITITVNGQEFLAKAEFSTEDWFTCGHFSPKRSNPYYNDMPEGLKEISLDEWRAGMFTYCIKPVESRQVRGDGTCDLRMFDVPNFDNKKIGFAIKYDWFDNENLKQRDKPLTLFCRYGLDKDWESFQAKFAAQFAGDNT